MWCVDGHVSRPGSHGALGNVWGETRWQPKPAMSCCYPSNCPLWFRLLDTYGCRSSAWHSLWVLSPAAQNCCVTSVKTYEIKILLFCPVRNSRGSVCVVSSLSLCSVCAVLMETVLPVCSPFSLSWAEDFFPSPSLHIWRAHGVELSAAAESTYSQDSSHFPLNVLYTCWVFFHASYCDALVDVVILGNMKGLV